MKTFLRQAGLPLLLVLLVALLTRLPLLLDYPPATYPDTGTYVQAAKDLVSGDFSLGQGRRTPGYPLVLVMLHGDPSRVMAFQLAGGVVVALLLFSMVLSLTGSRAWALVAGLAHAVNLQQVFVEGALVTEATSCLSVVAALALLVDVTMRLKRGETPMPALVGLGVLSTYALFVRPQFICLLVVAPLAVVYAVSGWHWPKARSFAAAGLVVAPAIALLLGWSAVQQMKTGHFTLSTQSGFGMVNHPIDYIELAPDEFAQVRDILIRVRNARLDEVGHSRNTIWYAWPEIQQATGWSLPVASRQLQSMCRQIFLAYPDRYVRSVASAWVDFWTVPFFWKPEQVQPAALRHAIKGMWWVQHKLLRLANLGFVLLVAGVLVWPGLRRLVRWDLALSAISATVLMSSVIQALADQGASSRYHLPTQSLVLLVLAVAVARTLASRRRSTNSAVMPGRA